jgi:hypothetical protein
MTIDAAPLEPLAWWTDERIDAVVLRLAGHDVLARELVEERDLLEERRQRVVALRELRELLQVVQPRVAVGEVRARVVAVDVLDDGRIASEGSRTRRRVETPDSERNGAARRRRRAERQPRGVERRNASSGSGATRSPPRPRPRTSRRRAGKIFSARFHESSSFGLTTIAGTRARP